ncbi:MAG: methyltransferase [Pseudomonadota bacterium]
MTSPWAETELRRDAFLGGRVHLWQPVRGYRAGVDPVLLAAAVPAQAGQSVLDLGCGSGAAGLCLAARVPGVLVTGLERQAGYAALAVRNGMDVVEGDVAAIPAALRARSFDHVIANPPYFDRAQGARALDAGREGAMGEETPLEAWVDAAARRLKHHGYAHFIHRPERLPDLACACQARLGSVEVLPLAPRARRAPSLILVRARKGGRAPFRLHFPRILHRGDVHEADGDDYTAEFAGIFRAAAALEF